MVEFLDSRSAPAKVTVSVFGSDGIPRTSKADSKGAFRIAELLPGRATFTVAANSEPPRERPTPSTDPAQVGRVQPCRSATRLRAHRARCWTMYGLLSNLAAEKVAELEEHSIDEFVYLKSHPELVASFAENSELSLDA